MSRLTEIKKQNPDYDISIIDTLNLLLKNQKPKYIEMILNMFKRRVESRITEEDYEHYKKELQQTYGVEEVDLEGMDNREIMFYARIASNFVPEDEFTIFRDFISLYERNLIEKKDITAIKSFDEVRELVSIAEIKGWDKEMENQIIIDMDNEETGWLLVRPLTYEASKKYGSATKWCTTQRDNSSYFYRYWRNILVYCINRKTGYKVAMHYSLGDREVSFWDSADLRVDSMMTELSKECLNKLMSIINEGKTNRQLTPGEFAIEEELSVITERGLYDLPMEEVPTYVVGGNGINITTTTGDNVIRLNPPNTLIYNGPGISDWVSTLSDIDLNTEITNE
jgi:hypothetical protein